MTALAELLDLSGVGRGRVWLKWVSSAEGKLFADYVDQVSRVVEDLGPFDKDHWHFPLAAMRRTLSSMRIRWLTGMERHLEEKGNVYGEKVAAERYQTLLRQALQEEYQKALVLESLNKEEGRLVRQIAAVTGLTVHTVATCLVDLEKEGLAGVAGYEDRDPRLIRLGD